MQNLAPTNKWNVEKPITFQSLKGLKITLTGGAGFVGRQVLKELLARGAQLENIYIPRSQECDLRLPEHAARAVKDADLVIHLAAKVGGIGMNRQCPADLIYDNAMMGLNVVHESKKAKVKKLAVAGTVCAYPKFTPVPFKETDLWAGYPEETNAPYGVAKKMILVALEAYRSQYGLSGIFLLPTNLFGPYDNFDLETSHVIPALIRKFLEAKEQGKNSVEIWGDGSPTREFLYVDDCARGIVDAVMKYDGPEPINLGTQQETNIKDLAEMIKDLVDYKGGIEWNTEKPNGQPRRKLDTTRAKEAFGFQAQVDLYTGLRRTIDWYLVNQLKNQSRASSAMAPQVQL